MPLKYILKGKFEKEEAAWYNPYLLTIINNTEQDIHNPHIKVLMLVK